MMKKWIAGALAVSMCLAAVSCDNNEQTGSTSNTTESSSVISMTDSQTTASTETSDTTVTFEINTETTGQNPVEPQPSEEISDIEYVQVGSYVTLVYNAASADVTYEAKKGVGSRETVTLTVSMKNDYTFDGWSEGDGIVNGASAVSKALTYTFDVSKDKTIYLNSSMTLYYIQDPSISGLGRKETCSVVFHQNPNTLPEKGYFKREGYTLIGYNTEADGSGEFVSLGAKVTANGKGTIVLHCVWAENAPESDFEWKEEGGGITVTKYSGSAEIVTIPETIGGKTVLKIARDAFKNNETMKQIVVAKTITTIEGYAFQNCKALETVTLFDKSFGQNGIADSSFYGCSALETIHLNTVYTLTNEWVSWGAAKFDRLMWAKDKKKVIIIGGSGSLFGYDCSILDEALGGEYEIVNLGENANITSLMYFDVVEDFVGEGDIILWCPEPGSATLGSTKIGSRLWDFRKGDYGFSQYLNPSYYDNFFSSFAAYNATLRTKTFIPFDRLSKTISKYGDNTSDREWNGQKYNYSFTYPMQAKTQMTEVVSNIIEKGAKVYFSFAAMQESGMVSVKEDQVKSFENTVLSIPGIESISEYTNCIYSDDCFYDSGWHLTDEGARIRTERVAKDLLAALEK